MSSLYAPGILSSTYARVAKLKQLLAQSWCSSTQLLGRCEAAESKGQKPRTTSFVDDVMAGSQLSTFKISKPSALRKCKTFPIPERILEAPEGKTPLGEAET